MILRNVALILVQLWWNWGCKCFKFWRILNFTQISTRVLYIGFEWTMRLHCFFKWGIRIFVG